MLDKRQAGKDGVDEVWKMAASNNNKKESNKREKKDEKTRKEGVGGREKKRFSEIQGDG